MSNPRLIATTASAALIAGVAAGTAVYAVDTVTGDTGSSTVADSAEQQATQLQQPQDDKTTVYREPAEHDDDDDDEGYGTVQPAPPSTQWNQPAAPKSGANTSKSS